MTKWYAKITNRGSVHEQGLVIDEKTGANIAVTYDPKDAPLVAAAPDLLAALEVIVEICGNRNTVEFDNARAAIRKAKEDAT